MSCFLFQRNKICYKTKCPKKKDSKIENKSNIDKICRTSFDEIYIKQFLEYSKDYDFIEGFEDFGRSNKTSNSVMVFMARGIFRGMEISIGIFFSTLWSES